MRCLNCNELLDDDSLFCPACGSNVAEMKAAMEAAVQIQAPSKMFCHECGMEYEEGDEFCGGCGTNLKKKSLPADNGGLGSKTGKTGSRFSGKIKNKVNIKRIAGAVAVIAVVVLGVIVIPKLSFGKKDAKGQLFYLKDNEIFKNKGKKNIPVADDIFEDKDDLDYIYNDVCLSEDGKILFYPVNYENGRFDLYYKKAESEKDKGTKIDSEVYMYSILAGDRVIYVKESGTSNKMYIADMKGNKEKVASDIADYYVSKDKKKIIYTVYDDGARKLYVTDSACKKGSEKIDSDVSNIVTFSKDLKNIYYAKYDVLYVCRNFKDKEKIESNVSTFYSARDEEDNVHLYYIVDKNKSDYISISKYLDEDVAADSYEASQIKAEIENRLCNFQSRELYYYTEKYGSMLLAEGNFDCRMGLYGSFSYSVATGKTEKKMKLSKLLEMDWSEISNEIEHAASSGAILRINDFGRDITVEYDTNDYACMGNSLAFHDEDKEIDYLILGKPGKKELTLFAVNLTDGSVTEIADDVYSSLCIVDGTVYYVADFDYDDYEKGGDLYAGGKLVDSDVNHLWVATDKKHVMYYKDKRKFESTLMITNGTKKQEVAEDVYSYADSKNGDIAVLCDYDQEDMEGDLMLYHNKKLIKVDSNVNGMSMMD